MQGPATARRFHRQRFGVKIVLLVLAVIGASQALGTFLSVLSFEDVYLEALLSKYEILGTDLNRKIEQAMKFGKPLDRLLGMDEMAEELFRRAEELEEASVFDSAGRPLFSFQRVEFVVARGVVDEAARGRSKVLLGDEEELETRYTGDLEEFHGPWPRVRLAGGKYRLVFPIKPPFGSRQGYLELAFGKSVVDAKTWELVRRSVTKLIAAIALTGLAAALLIRFLFVGPARRQVGDMETALFGDGEAPDPGSPEAAQEIRQVQRSLEAYISMTADARDEVRRGLEGLERSPEENPHAARVLRLMKQVLRGETHGDG
jgi:hypothetical protein